MAARVLPAGAQRLTGRRQCTALSTAAFHVLAEAHLLRSNDSPDALIFSSRVIGRALSDLTLSAIMRRAKVQGFLHGFWSAFGDLVL